MLTVRSFQQSYRVNEGRRFELLISEQELKNPVRNSFQTGQFKLSETGSIKTAKPGLIVLSFRELRASASFLEAVFLSLDHSTVSSQESVLAQQAVQAWIHGFQSSGDPHHDGTGLTGRSAAVNSNPQINVSELLGDA